jgi:hypothetical protein
MLVSHFQYSYYLLQGVEHNIHTAHTLEMFNNRKRKKREDMHHHTWRWYEYEP